MKLPLKKLSPQGEKKERRGKERRRKEKCRKARKGKEVAEGSGGKKKGKE